MKRSKLKSIFFLLFVFGLSIIAKSQSALVSSGSEATGSNGKVSYSIGLVVYTISSGVGGTVSSGIQNPYNIIATDIEEEHSVFNITAFPNPTTSNITLKTENYNLENLSLQMYDLRGRLLYNEKITGIVTEIATSHFEGGIYFLKITDNNKELNPNFAVEK